MASPNGDWLIAHLLIYSLSLSFQKNTTTKLRRKEQRWKQNNNVDPEWERLVGTTHIQRQKIPSSEAYTEHCIRQDLEEIKYIGLVLALEKLKV